MRPQERIEQACRTLGRPAVIDRCLGLLAGGAEEPEFIAILGGPPAIRLLDDGGVRPDQRYWLRVWAARGLLWAGPGGQVSVLRAALTDDAWRVREMTCKVIARHRVADLLQDVASLTTTTYPGSAAPPNAPSRRSCKTRPDARPASPFAAAPDRVANVPTLTADARCHMLLLRPLEVEDEAAAVQAQAELADEDFTFLLDRDRTDAFADYLALLDRQHQGTDDHPDRVRASFLVAELDDELVGRVSLRHELNDHLRHEGGHIGFGVRPAFRRRGLATQMLQLTLRRAAGLGIDEALLTCDDDNIGSQRVIERCGGRLVETVTASDGRPMRHYLLTTAPYAAA